MELGEILISEREIAGAVEEIAAKVRKDYDPSKLVLVGAMDGAVCFLADLMRSLSIPVTVTTVRMRRYEGTEGGELTVSWLPLRERIEGRRPHCGRRGRHRGHLRPFGAEAAGFGGGVRQHLRPAEQTRPPRV